MDDSSEERTASKSSEKSIKKYVDEYRSKKGFTNSGEWEPLGNFISRSGIGNFAYASRYYAKINSNPSYLGIF